MRAIRYRVVCCAVFAFAAMAAWVGRTQGQVTSYELVVDEDASSFQVSGRVYGLELGGDRRTALGGAFDIRVDRPQGPFRGFIIDDSTLLQLDALQPTLKNPIPFLPPLGELNIENVSMRLVTRVIPLNGTGAFVNFAAIEVLSGTVSGEVLGRPIEPTDLTGTAIDRAPIAGTLVQNGDMITLTFPLEFAFDDPSTNTHVEVAGQVVAEALAN